MSSPRYRRLRTLAFGLGAAAFVLAFFHRVAPGAIAVDIREAFSTSATTLGFVAAFYFYPYALMQLPSGVLADSIGPRRLFTAGSLVAGLGSILFGLATSVPWLLAGRALVGLGVAVAFISVLKLIASWYREREFATWVGVLQFIGNMGAVLAVFPLAWVAQQASWRGVFLATGVLSLAVGLAIWFGLRDTPAEAGLPSPDGAPRSAPATQAHWLEGLRLVARNGQTWAAFSVNFGMVGSYMAFAGIWAVPYLMEAHGLSREEATLRLTVMIFGFAFCAPAVGTLSDRVRRRRPLLRGMALLSFLSWLPFVLGWSLGGSALTVVLWVIGMGVSCAVLSWAVGKEVNPPALAGTATSLVNTAGFLGGALLQPLVGWVLDHSAGLPVAEAYQRALGLLAVTSFIGVVGAFRLRETHCRNVWSEGR